MRTELCDMVGIKHPIIQAGMGPWNTEKLAIAAANAGILGIMSSAGARTKEVGALERYRDDVKERYTIVKQLIRNVAEGTREQEGIFGVNCMVSVEIREVAKTLISGALDAREEDLREPYDLSFGRDKVGLLIDPATDNTVGDEGDNHVRIGGV